MQDQRLLVLSLMLGLDFGILVLFANNWLGIGVVLVLITAAVFAASRDDLREMARHKILVAFMVLVAVFEVSFSITVADQFGGDFIFEALTSISFIVLIVYIVMSRMRGFRTEVDAKEYR